MLDEILTKNKDASEKSELVSSDQILILLKINDFPLSCKSLMNLQPARQVPMNSLVDHSLSNKNFLRVFKNRNYFSVRQSLL